MISEATFSAAVRATSGKTDNGDVPDIRTVGMPDWIGRPAA